MFLAPAAIFGAFFLWMTGDPRDAVAWLDRTLVHAGYLAWTWGAALLEALLK